MSVKSSAKGDEKVTPEVEENLPFEEPKEKVEVKEQPQETKEEEPEDLDPKYMDMLKELQGKIATLEAARVAPDKADTVDILDDDYLAEPRIYHCFSSYYAIWDDTQLGKYIPTPYNRPIRFKKLYRFTKSDKTGRGVQTVSVSQAIVHSKREVNWIENHTLYNIKFAREMKGAEDGDVMLAEKMVEIANMVSGLDDMAVIGRARSEEINTQTADVDLIRKQLIKKLALDAMSKEKHKKQLRVKDMAKTVENRKIEDTVETTGTVEEVY